LISQAREGFTVNLINEDVVLIWHDGVGSLFSGVLGDDGISANELISGQKEFGQYFAMSDDDGVNLVYDMPVADGASMLMSQTLKRNGIWGAVKHIDNINILQHGQHKSLFNLVPIAKKHFLAVYFSGGFESKLGYREIYGKEIGSYNLVHSSIHKFGDHSFLATIYDLHIAYVVRGVFGSRLIYKKKGKDGFSPGVVVAEGQGLHNVVVYMLDDKLHIMFMRGDELFCVNALGGGHSWSFLPLSEYDKSRNKQLSKAFYLSGDDDVFLTNELLVDKENPWKIHGCSKYIYARCVNETKTQNSNDFAENNINNKDYDNFFSDMEGELAEYIRNNDDNKI